MLTPIPLTFIPFYSSFPPYSLFLEQTNQIYEIGIAIFTKISIFFKNFNNHSKEMNVKALAMVSFLSLITLLVISMLRQREVQS